MSALDECSRTVIVPAGPTNSRLDKEHTEANPERDTMNYNAGKPFVVTKKR